MYGKYNKKETNTSKRLVWLVENRDVELNEYNVR